MSGNIQGVNVQKLTQEANEYSSLANKMRVSLSNICKNIKDLRIYWTGASINRVINEWNNHCDDIVTNASYFYNNIDSILNNIYNQYDALEKNQVANSNVTFDIPSNVYKIELTDEANMTFDKTNTENIYNQIVSEVTNVKTYLKQLLTKLDSMQAYSDSLKKLVTTYQQTANNVQSSLTKVCDVIQEKVKQEKQNVNTTEQNNEDDVKRASIPSGNGQPSAQ